MTKAIGYIRVSTNTQSESGQSLLSQSERIIGFAQMNGFDLGQPIERDCGQFGKIQTRERILFEVESAHKTRLFSRQAGRALQLCERGEVILFAKLDRVFRNVSDCLDSLEQLDKAGVGVYILNIGGNQIDMHSAVGKLILTFLAACATFESDTKAERIADWHGTRIRNMMATGNIDRVLFRRQGPKGRRVLVPCPRQRAHSRIFYRLYYETGYAVHEIEQWAKENLLRQPEKGKLYRIDRIRLMIRAEFQLREIAAGMDLPDDDERVLHAWLIATKDEKNWERRILPESPARVAARQSRRMGNLQRNGKRQRHV